MSNYVINKEIANILKDAFGGLNKQEQADVYEYIKDIMEG